MTLITEHLKVLPDTLNAPYIRARLKLIAILTSICIFVGLPTLTVAVYYGLIASDIYISEAEFAVKRSQDSLSSSLLGGIIGSADIGGGSNTDVEIVSQYLGSLDLVAVLDESLDLRNHYGSPDVDIVARLSSDASREDFLEYYIGMMDILPDEKTGIVSIRVRAFDAEMSQKIALAVIAASEDLVNRVSNRISRDAIAFSEQELSRAEDLLRRHAAALSEVRESNQAVDPITESQSVIGILSGLEGQLAESRAEMAVSQSFMRADSPQMKALQIRISALEGEIARQRNRVSAGDGGTLTELMDAFEPAMLERELALERYKTALASLELARRDALADRLYLVPFITPSLPEEAVEPIVWQKVLTTFLITLFTYGIGGLVWAAMKEHISVP